MQWYKGLIPEAIAQAKRNKALFVVYISGDDEESKKMDQTWLDESISQICQNANCVALRIDAKSDVCQQFNQIYPVVVIPSTFFIGNNGVPLEVIGGCIAVEDFKRKVSNVIDLHGDDVTTESSTDVSPEDDSTDRQLAANSDFPNASSPYTDSVASSNLTDTGEVLTNNASIEDKIDRARILIEEKKNEKTEQQKQIEVKKEVERRKLGQDMAKMKRQRNEAEAKELAEKISKERAADKAARERILKQIAEDREEKKRRYITSQEMIDKAKEDVKSSKLILDQLATQSSLASKSTHSRIQFRLPDGSSITHQFLANGQFIEAQQFISQQVGDRFGHFTLSTTFPRRDFTETDNSQTFRELQMVPTSVVIVLPGRSLIPSYPHDWSISSWFWFILTPVVFFLNLLKQVKSSIFSRLSPSAPDNSSFINSTASSDSSQSRERSSSSAYKRTQSSNSTDRGSSISRREGNIHRFANTDDDNDDNNTWNGNSTQQM